MPQHVEAQVRGHRLGFLLSQYPAISHTFFLQEIRGLRELGLEIEAASVNCPDRPLNQLTPSEAQEAGTTFYLKSGSPLRNAMRIAVVALRNPGAAWRAVVASQRIGPMLLGNRLYALFYAAEAMLLLAWIREKRITHLHAHFGGAVAFVAYITSAAARLPYSMTIHGPDEFFDEAVYHLRAKVAGAAFVIAISDYCRSQLMRIAGGSSWDRIDVVRLGVKPETLPQPIPAAHGSPLRLVCVGRLVPTKGPLLLLQALHQVRARGVDCSLTMVGDGTMRAALEQAIQDLGLAGSVTLTGALNHDQALDRVAAADIFILASFAEGIPVALMEAMAIGIPCISTFIAGIPELIRTEECGLLVPAGSVDALRDAILRLAEDSALRGRIAEAGRRQVLREYHLPDNLAQLARIWRSRLGMATETA